MTALRLKKPTTAPRFDYSGFDKLDGDHPLMQVLPKGYVPYQVRELRTGEIAYFNYALAKAMGLIPKNHPHQMNKVLSEKLLKTFSIQIINEFDSQAGQKKEFTASSVKPKQYMASRYLQLQHPNKQGKTSGDGRSIWNGVIRHNGKIWDVSSRGTGVTCLAPGVVEAQRPLQTGGSEFGYGCGLAEIDELYGAALMAELVHMQGIQTERVLCVVDLGKGFGIGVRAAPNLLRPAHMFMYLKQNRLKELKASLDYFIGRQVTNSHEWRPKSTGPAVYSELMHHLAKSFAKFTAQLDVDYIFAWLDWDGDNVLANAGIIDYGSVRQFGLRHDQYRYDDSDRFSTNLNEQRRKACMLIQVFCQIADYVQTGQKKPLQKFANHPYVQLFVREFGRQRSNRRLYRMGFDPIQRKKILDQTKLYKQFENIFHFFEGAKVKGPLRKVPDGLNRPALFDMRAICRELPRWFLKNGFKQFMPAELFMHSLLPHAPPSKRRKYTRKYSASIHQFQWMYVRLLKKSQIGKAAPLHQLELIANRASRLSHENRITGNALIQIVEEILAQKKRGASHADIQSWIDHLIFLTVGLPEVDPGPGYPGVPRMIQNPSVLEKLMNLVQVHKHDI